MLREASHDWTALSFEETPHPILVILRPLTNIDHIRQRLDRSQPEQVEIHGCITYSKGEFGKHGQSGATPDGVSNHLQIDGTVSVLESCLNVNRLVLKDIVWGFVSMASRGFLLQRFATITALHLQNVDCFGPNQLLRILNAFPRLAELTLWTVDWTMPRAPQTYQLVHSSPLRVRKLVLPDTEAAQLVCHWVLGRRVVSRVQDLLVNYITQQEALLDMIWLAKLLRKSACYLEQLEYRVIEAEPVDNDIPKVKGSGGAEADPEVTDKLFEVGPLEHYGLDENNLTLKDDAPPLAGQPPVPEAYYAREFQTLSTQAWIDKWAAKLDKAPIANSAMRNLSVYLPWFPECMFVFRAMCQLVTPRTRKFKLALRFADIVLAAPWLLIDDLLSTLSVCVTEGRFFDLSVCLEYIMDNKVFDMSVRSALPRACARGHRDVRERWQA